MHEIIEIIIPAASDNRDSFLIEVIVRNLIDGSYQKIAWNTVTKEGLDPQSVDVEGIIENRLNFQERLVYESALNGFSCLDKEEQFFQTLEQATTFSNDIS